VKTLRQLHLYLGCFFAPLVAFFAFTGFLQTYNLHEAPKDKPQPPAWIKTLAMVHKDQHLARNEPAAAMKFLTAAMAVALTVTMVLGVVMAFKFGRSRLAVIGCLVLGAVIPLAAVWFAHLGSAP
jgi:hypothetical protein